MPTLREWADRLGGQSRWARGTNEVVKLNHLNMIIVSYEKGFEGPRLRYLNLESALALRCAALDLEGEIIPWSEFHPYMKARTRRALELVEQNEGLL